jgi:hypothetical protein
LLLNHSIHQNGTFAERSRFAWHLSPALRRSALRNEGDHFTDATKQSAINSSAIGYGLGIAISDIDLDGSPDLYVGMTFMKTTTSISTSAMAHFVKSRASD